MIRQMLYRMNYQGLQLILLKFHNHKEAPTQQAPREQNRLPAKKILHISVKPLINKTGY